MKRKINLVGTNTLTVSLPFKWVNKVGLNKGDEIEMDIQGNNLILNGEYKPTAKAINLNFSTLYPKQMKWAIQISYKQGYDEMRINYKNPETINIIEQELKYCPGLEIIQQEENKCTLKNIAKNLSDEFDNAMRRNFLNSLYMVELMIERIKKGELASLKELKKYEDINNKLCCLCERMVNEVRRENNTFSYVVIWQLEKIVDEYKNICMFLSENSNTKISKELLLLLEDGQKIFRQYYELYYKFSMEKQKEIERLNKSITKKGLSMLLKGKGNENAVINLIMRASDRIKECVPSTFALHSDVFEAKN